MLKIFSTLLVETIIIALVMLFMLLGLCATIAALFLDLACTLHLISTEQHDGAVCELNDLIDELAEKFQNMITAVGEL